MRDESLKKALWHLTGLLRARVIICLIGLWAMKSSPEIAHWIVTICGMAIGVSAMEAMKGKKDDGSK